MRRKGIALVGLGLAVRPHALSLMDLSAEAEVLYAVSQSQARCAAFAADYPFPTATDLEKALTDERVEAVILLTPPSTHRDLGSRILESGRHLLIEKPVGLVTADAEALQALAEARGLKLGVVFQHRFRPAFLRLAELVAEGSLGPLAAGHCRVPWWRPQSYYDEPGRGMFARDGGGVLLTQAIHTLDLLRALVGRIDIHSSLVSTTALHEMEAEDHVAALATFGGRAPGTIMATTACYPGFPETIDLVFATATAHLEGGVLNLFRHDGSSETVGRSQAFGSGADPMAFAHDAHRALITDFLRAIDEDRAPAVSGADIVATRRLIDAMLARSISKGIAP